MPDVIAHKGASLSGVVSHMWLTTEGVFGIALGVSTSFIFLFVLFGSLLDKAGGRQLHHAGELRAARPHARRAGQGGRRVVGAERDHLRLVGRQRGDRRHLHHPADEAGRLPAAIKAGAIETSSSVNGQIMPPVMGAAAFLMVEYVGIPYTQVIKHASCRRSSYIALFYIVHLEALKAACSRLPRAQPAVRCSGCWRGLTVARLHRAVGRVYYGIGWIKAVFPRRPFVLGAVLLRPYLGLRVGRRAPARPAGRLDDPNPGVRTARDLADGEGRPALPAPGGGADLVPDGRGDCRRAVGLLGDDAHDLLMVTQRPLIALFRGAATWARATGLRRTARRPATTGARNMIGIGVATAGAGIIVGTDHADRLGLRDDRLRRASSPAAT
jgi:TRAP-type uncharacterized transport system fused permease subunit